MGEFGRVGKADQALAVPATPANAVDGPPGFDPSRMGCAYWDRGWACREGGYLWDEDSDGYDPSDCTYPCPACNTREYLELGVEFAKTLSQSMCQYVSGAEQWRYRVETALGANPAEAPRLLAEIGPVECLDWAVPEAPHFDHTVAVIENVAAIATEARRAETVKQGSVHEGAGREAALPSQDTPSPPEDM